MCLDWLMRMLLIIFSCNHLVDTSKSSVFWNGIRLYFAMFLRKCRWNEGWCRYSDEFVRSDWSAINVFSQSQWILSFIPSTLSPKFFLSLAIPFSLDITICYLWFKDVLVLIENVVSSFSTCNLWAIKRYSKSKGICHILNQLLPWQPTRKGRSVKLSRTVLWWISWHRGIYPTSRHSRCQQHRTKVAGFSNLMYHCL